MCAKDGRRKKEKRKRRGGKRDEDGSASEEEDGPRTHWAKGTHTFLCPPKKRGEKSEKKVLFLKQTIKRRGNFHMLAE